MELVIISGKSHPKLAQEIVAHNGHRLGRMYSGRFADHEIKIQIGENVRARHVVIVQSTHANGDNWLELLLMIDAAKRAGAGIITVVMPYMGYSRQDQKDRPRAPISVALMVNLLATAGADQLCTIDLHSGQSQGLFTGPFENLYFSSILLDSLGVVSWPNTVIVSPDAGGLKRCRALAQQRGAPVAAIDKRRPEPNQSEVMNVMGDVAGKDAVMLDDMIDTAGTITKGAQAIKDAGANRVWACATHPILSRKALALLRNSVIERVVVGNTIPIPKRKQDAIGSKLKVVSSAPLLGEAILRIHSADSLSALFPTKR